MRLSCETTHSKQGMLANSMHVITCGWHVANLVSQPCAVLRMGMRQKPSCQAETDIYNRAVAAFSWYENMRAQ